MSICWPNMIARVKVTFLSIFFIALSALLCFSLFGCGTQAAFEKFKITCGIEKGKSYTYTTVNQAGESVAGTLSVTKFETITSDSTHIQMDGFEWQIMEATIDFSASDVARSPICYDAITKDYYDFASFDASLTATGNNVSFKIKKDGKEYTCSGNVWWENIGETTSANGASVFRVVQHKEMCVPKGYDGIVAGFVNHASQDNMYKKDSGGNEVLRDFNEYYKDNDFMLFRFKQA